MFPLHILTIYRNRQILCHDPVVVDYFHARSLQVLAPVVERVIPV